MPNSKKVSAIDAVKKSASSHLDAARSSGSSPSVEFNPADLLPIEEVARRLHTDVSWVREKIRRRCPNAMPVHNLGRHLLFHWPDVCDWIRNSQRPIHAAHKRRTKLEKKAA
jgi:hypothetical protein